MAHDDRLRLQKLSQRLAAAFEASTQWHRQRCERTADALRLVAATRELNISALLAQPKPAVPVSGVNDLTLVSTEQTETRRSHSQART